MNCKHKYKIIMRKHSYDGFLCKNEKEKTRI